MSNNVALPPMEAGGVWLRVAQNTPPVYVAHEAHIKRLLADGAERVPDPRDPVLWNKQGQVAPSVESTLRAELEELKAQMARLLASPRILGEVEQSKSEQAPAEASIPAKKAR